MTTKKYKHCENGEEHLTLHDCYISSASFNDGVLSFEFYDGFWIYHDHPSSELSHTVRTDCSKAEFIVDYIDYADKYDIVISVLRKKLFGRTLITTWTLDEFITNINSGKIKFELLYQYKNTDSNERIIKGIIHRPKNTYSECIIKIVCSKVNYYWNDLRPDAKW